MSEAHTKPTASYANCPGSLLISLPPSWRVLAAVGAAYIEAAIRADALRAAEQRIAALEGALRFYAEPWKYTDCHGDDVRVPDFYSELDFGETARAALAKHKKPGD